MKALLRRGVDLRVTPYLTKRSPIGGHQSKNTLGSTTHIETEVSH